jgi:hypothetical protein
VLDPGEDAEGPEDVDKLGSEEQGPERNAACRRLSDER